MINTALNQMYSDVAEKRIFESLTFLDKITNVTKYLNAKTVSIPNYTTATATIGINTTPTDYNAFSQTAETYTTFNIDSYRVPTIAVENIEEMQTSYDKFQLVTDEKIAELANAVGNVCLQKLAADVTIATKTIFTSGSNGTSNGPGGVGNRKKLVLADLIRLQALMNNDNLSLDKRWYIVQPSMYAELISDDGVLKFLNFNGSTSVAETGIVSEVIGFKILIKPTIAFANSSGTSINAFNQAGTAGASTDNLASLAFHEDVLVRADSGVKTYIVPVVSQLYGGTISAEYIFGVKNKRFAGDNKGVYLVIQGQ